MTNECADFLIDMLDGTDVEASIIKQYSYDYQLTTLGLRVNKPPGKVLATVLSSIFAIPSFETDDYPEVSYQDFQNLKSDRLGLNYVIY